MDWLAIRPLISVDSPAVLSKSTTPTMGRVWANSLANTFAVTTLAGGGWAAANPQNRIVNNRLASILIVQPFGSSDRQYRQWSVPEQVFTGCRFDLLSITKSKFFEEILTINWQAPPAPHLLVSAALLVVSQDRALRVKQLF
jgi:hypothetical protein